MVSVLGCIVIAVHVGTLPKLDLSICFIIFHFKIDITPQDSMYYIITITVIIEL